MNKDCKYPNCEECDREDCDMTEKAIAAMLKRRRYHNNPEAYRQAQNDYRARRKENLPYCDGCENCVLVAKEKQEGFRRVCVDQMRLIEQKVSNSPQWCSKRKEKQDGTENQTGDIPGGHRVQL